jgi:hypothetical protein
MGDVFIDFSPQEHKAPRQQQRESEGGEALRGEGAESFKSYRDWTSRYQSLDSLRINYWRYGILSAGLDYVSDDFPDHLRSKINAYVGRVLSAAASVLARDAPRRTWLTAAFGRDYSFLRSELFVSGRHVTLVRFKSINGTLESDLAPEQSHSYSSTQAIMEQAEGPPGPLLLNWAEGPIGTL